MVRALTILLLLGGMAGLGVVAWLQMRPPPAQQRQAVVIERAPILVAARPMRVGTLLKPEDLAVQQVPVAELPPGALRDSPTARLELTGAIVRRTLTAAEPMGRDDVLRPGDHGFLAAVLGAGMRAVTVSVDAVSGSAGLIWPGDRVDLLLTQTLDSRDDPARRVAGETVLRDVRVIAIDQLLTQGAEGSSAGASRQVRTVTLEVTPRQAEQVAVATRIGRIALVVRSATRPGGEEPGEMPAPPEPPTITWAGDVSPALRGGAPVEPGAAATMRIFQGAGRAEEFRF
jgi:pilus assembly protein CpaB